ncbi:MAG: hypothetical protein R2747_09835 [Pyrinomonadaceae bacterium]
MIFKQYDEFPKFGAFLDNRFPMLEAFSPEIFEVFAEFCMSKDLARQALKRGKYPLVKVKVLINPKIGKVDRRVGGLYAGECEPTEKNVIFIQKENVVAYEEGNGNPFFLERVILHETVHWARFIGRKPARTPDDKEAGSQFEIKAYNLPPASDHSDVPCS